MVIVRVLLAIALAVILGALLLYFVRRDRRYLVFIGKVLKYTLIVLAGVLVAFAIHRLLFVSPGPPG